MEDYCILVKNATSSRVAVKDGWEEEFCINSSLLVLLCSFVPTVFAFSGAFRPSNFYGHHRCM